MMGTAYTAAEYQADGRFLPVPYAFEPCADGWQIFRNGSEHLALGPGYQPLEVSYCGVCATDLARANLPHPLPQVTGHEVVGRDRDGQRFVVEINASHHARGVDADCPFCREGLPSHCPERITLGINRLPGGFAPFLLAPKAGLYPVPDHVSDEVAALTEPLAAALHAVRTTPPEEGARVAVLGPRRLGGLLVAALAAERRRLQRDFHITAVVRHQALGELARKLGADAVVNLRNQPVDAWSEAFDIVYDTTGQPAGLATALQLARLKVHLKSTHGHASFGLQQLTALVVDELALVPPLLPVISQWPLPKRVAVIGEGSARAVLPPGLAGPGVQVERLSRRAAATYWQEQHSVDGLPRFDMVFATAWSAIDFIIRPNGQSAGLLRPRGALVLSENCMVDNALCRAILQRGIRLESSRCGDYPAALALLADDEHLVQTLQTHFITHIVPLADIQSAFELAADSQRAVKVLIKTS